MPAPAAAPPHTAAATDDEARQGLLATAGSANVRGRQRLALAGAALLATVAAACFCLNASRVRGAPHSHVLQPQMKSALSDSPKSPDKGLGPPERTLEAEELAEGGEESGSDGEGNKGGGGLHADDPFYYYYDEGNATATVAARKALEDCVDDDEAIRARAENLGVILGGCAQDAEELCENPQFGPAFHKYCCFSCTEVEEKFGIDNKSADDEDNKSADDEDVEPDDQDACLTVCEVQERHGTCVQQVKWLTEGADYDIAEIGSMPHNSIDCPQAALLIKHDCPEECGGCDLEKAACDTSS